MLKYLKHLRPCKKALLEDLQAVKDTEAPGRLWEHFYQRSSELVRGAGIYKEQTEQYVLYGCEILS